MISVRDLDFAYQPRDFRLRVQALEIQNGQRVAWYGPSGSGKTTLLQLVAGILTPAQGQVETCGIELTSLSDAERRDFRITNLGLAFQEFELIDYLSVRDNVLLPYMINGALPLTVSVREFAEHLLESVELKEATTRRPDQLSHGQRQRVAVCRALVTQPKLVLADEPTANLDPENKRRVFELLNTYVKRAGATLVVVTHDQELAGRFDRALDVSALVGKPFTTARGANEHA